MKEYFDKQLVGAAKQHAVSEFPKESCGFFIKNEYIPMKNLAKNKETDFKIDPSYFIQYEKEIDCIVHSHINYPHASKKDMQQQIATAKPWGIINMKNGHPRDTIFWGDQLEPQDLIGRSFFHGVYDCFSLVRDYYRIEKKILIKNIPREWKWWKTDPSLLEDNFKKVGFKKIEISNVRPGDGVFMKIDAPVVNHSGVILDRGLILHHIVGHLSKRDQIGQYKNFISGYLRYTGC